MLKDTLPPTARGHVAPREQQVFRDALWWGLRGRGPSRPRGDNAGTRATHSGETKLFYADRFLAVDPIVEFGQDKEGVRWSGRPSARAEASATESEQA